MANRKVSEEEAMSSVRDFVAQNGLSPLGPMTCRYFPAEYIKTTGFADAQDGKYMISFEVASRKSLDCMSDICSEKNVIITVTVNDNTGATNQLYYL